MADTVEVPASLLMRLAEAAQAFQELEDELEDCLLGSDSELVARVRQARVEHVSGNVRPLSELKAAHCIE